MIVDTFHDRLSDARAEVERRRPQTVSERLITKIERFADGDFRVRSYPIEFALDGLPGFPMPDSFDSESLLDR